MRLRRRAWHRPDRYRGRKLRNRDHGLQLRGRGDKAATRPDGHVPIRWLVGAPRRVDHTEDRLKPSICTAKSSTSNRPVFRNYLPPVIVDSLWSAVEEIG